jgi:hypothetical protein
LKKSGNSIVRRRRRAQVREGEAAENLAKIGAKSTAPAISGKQFWPPERSDFDRVAAERNHQRQSRQTWT